MQEQELLLEKKQNIAFLTLNRERQRNALSPSLLTQLIKQLTELETDKDVRVVCITGAGDRSFCAGADLKAALSTGITPEQAHQTFAKMLQTMLAFPKPLVAKLNGHCMGGGVGIALACDIAIARDGIQIGTPEVRVGLFPMMISTLILQQMPRKRAYQMMLCGERLNAQEALQYGLLNKVVASEKLDEEVNQILHKLLQASPLAQQFGKRALYKTASLHFPQAVEELGSALAELSHTEDAIEGLTAFFEKREPIWKGK